MVNGARRFLRIGVRASPPGDRCCTEGERERLRRAAPSPLAMIVFAVEYCINRAKNAHKKQNATHTGVVVIFCGWDAYRSLTCCWQSPKIISSRSPRIQLFIIPLSRSFLHSFTLTVYAGFVNFASANLYIMYNFFSLIFDRLHNDTCGSYHI